MGGPQEHRPAPQPLWQSQLVGPSKPLVTKLGQQQKRNTSCRAHWGLRSFSAPFPGQLRTVTRAWQESERGRASPGREVRGGTARDTHTAPPLLLQKPLRRVGPSSCRTRTPAHPDPGRAAWNKDSHGRRGPGRRSGGLQGQGEAGPRAGAPGPPDDWTDRVSGACSARPPAPSSQLWPSFLSRVSWPRPAVATET